MFQPVKLVFTELYKTGTYKNVNMPQYKPDTYEEYSLD